MEAWERTHWAIVAGITTEPSGVGVWVRRAEGFYVLFYSFINHMVDDHWVLKMVMMKMAPTDLRGSRWVWEEHSTRAVNKLTLNTTSLSLHIFYITRRFTSLQIFPFRKREKMKAGRENWEIKSSVNFGQWLWGRIIIELERKKIWSNRSHDFKCI